MTPLDHIFARHPDSDKGTIHSYLDVYHDLFGPIRTQVLRVLEIGVRGGGSLKAWSEYFPQATIIGIDNGSEAGMWTPSSPHIHVYEADSTRPETLRGVARRYGTFDIVIDDGCHHPLVQAATWGALFPFVAGRGFYVIEDVEGITHAAELQRLFGGEILDRRAVNGRHDDILLVWAGAATKEFDE